MFASRALFLDFGLTGALFRLHTSADGLLYKLPLFFYFPLFCTIALAATDSDTKFQRLRLLLLVFSAYTFRCGDTRVKSYGYPTVLG